jgi:hypothetical protein
MAAHNRAGEMPAPEIRNGVLGYLIGGRFIPRMAGGETPPNPGEGDPPPGDGDKGKDGTQFDAARAQRTIDQLRDEVKASKAAAKDAEALKKRLQEIEDKDKSEVERLAGTAKEASEKLTAAEARARDLAIRLAVAETASALGITGASVKAAVRLLDTKALEFDEDTGEPTNVEKVLKALVAEYPMLATDAGEKPPAGAAKGTPPTPKPNGIPTKDQAVDDVYKRLTGAGGLSRW